MLLSIEYPDWTTAMIVVGGGIAAQILTAVLAWAQSRRNTEHIKFVAAKVTAVQNEQIETNHELNSRLTELVEAVRIAARSAGILEGIEQQKRRAITGDIGTPDPHAADSSGDLHKIGQSHAATGTPADAVNTRTDPTQSLS